VKAPKPVLPTLAYASPMPGLPFRRTLIAIAAIDGLYAFPTITLGIGRIMEVETLSERGLAVATALAGAALALGGLVSLRRTANAWRIAVIALSVAGPILLIPVAMALALMDSSYFGKSMHGPAEFRMYVAMVNGTASGVAAVLALGSMMFLRRADVRAAFGIDPPAQRPRWLRRLGVALYILLTALVACGMAWYIHTESASG
jgi:hypothetical protein